MDSLDVSVVEPDHADSQVALKQLMHPLLVLDVFGIIVDYLLPGMFSFVCEKTNTSHSMSVRDAALCTLASSLIEMGIYHLELHSDPRVIDLLVHCCICVTTLVVIHCLTCVPPKSVWN